MFGISSNADIMATSPWLGGQSLVCKNRTHHF